MALILKQESVGSVTTPPAGRSAVFVDSTGQLGVKQANGASVVTGNITSVNLDGSSSNVLYGNGVFAPGGGGGGSYGNSNVVTLLSAFGSNTITTTGNISAGNIITTGTSGNISGANVISATTLSATGMVFGSSFEGARANLTANLTAGNVVTGGSVVAGNIILDGTTGNVSGIGSIGVGFVTATSGMSTTSLTTTATTDLGAVGNVKISGGQSGYVLQTDGVGNLSWTAQSGGSANLESVTTDVLPSFDSVFDLGSTTKRWDNLFVATSANINGAVLTGATVGNTKTLTANAAFVANSVVATSALVGNVSIIANTISGVNSYGLPGTLSVTGNIAVGNVANVIIPGGSSGQVLTTNGSGGLSWASAGGLSGTSYVYVAGNGTAAENGAALVAAYATAKTMTPFGQGRSNTNRVTVVVAPGTYTATFNVDTMYIDVVSLTGGMDVKLSHINVTNYDCRLYGLDLGTNPFTCNWGATSDVNVFEYCRGGDYSFGYSAVSGQIIILNGTYKNCIGGNYSFGSINSASTSAPYLGGTFTECEAGAYSFGYQYQSSVGSSGPSLSGTFTRCKVTGNQGFGYVGAVDRVDGYGGATLSGTFNECFSTASGSSFGGGSYAILSGKFNSCYATGSYAFGHNANHGILSGTFNDCYAIGSDSFGSSNFGSLTLSGTFINCSADGYSFGNGYFAGNNTLSGKFINCTSAGATYNGVNSFGTAASASLTGTFTNCTSGNNSFGYGNTTTFGVSVFTNCVAGDNSFGYGNGVSDTTDTIFVNCRAGFSSFMYSSGGTTSSASGTYKDCYANNQAYGMNGYAPGTFINCVGGSYSWYRMTGTATSCVGGVNSFGWASPPTGKMYYCRLTSGTFPTVGSGGRTIYCIDGNNNTNNQ